MASIVNRNLYYYDLEAFCYEGSTNTVLKAENSHELINDFFKDLFERQAIGEKFDNFIIKTENDDHLFIIIDKVETEYIEYRIVLSRVDALPFIEENGNLESLGEYIDDGQNIAEITHCVLFTKYGVIGGEFNFAGARPSAISDYIVKLNHEILLVTCRAKLNLDVYSKLIKGEEYSLFDFSVKSNSNAYTKMLSNKSIFSVIREEVPESDTIEVILKKRKTKKNHNKGFICPLNDDEIYDLLVNHKEDISKFLVSQGTYKDRIDLLSDKLVNKITLVKTNNRTIDSKDVYREIIKFFDSTVVKYCL